MYSYKFRARKRPGRKGIRIALTTEDIAELLDTTPEAIRQRIYRGQLVFTGDSVADFHMLSSLVSV